MRAATILAATTLVLLSSAAPGLAQGPWDVDAPIVTVQKELYTPSPAPGVCQWCWSYYVGPDGQMVENYVQESSEWGDDRHMNPQRRFSNDNGQTWSSLESMPPIVSYVDGWPVQDGRLERPFYDPVADVVVRFSQQHVVYQGAAYNHAFYDISDDYGHTYGPRTLITYESGGAYDPQNIFDPNYLLYNNAAPGNNITRLSNGTILSSVYVSYVTVDGERQPYGTRNVIGTWNAPAHDYDWQIGAPSVIPSGMGFHGLYEPQVAELTDNRVLVTWRTDGGRPYYGISEDGGLNVSEPAAMVFDDGSPVYEVGSISAMLRSNLTGKLYYIGNFGVVPPAGRYPLAIAEIDETSTPSIKKNTMTVIDTRQGDEEPTIQLSNFSYLENRATNEIIMHVSPLGYIGGYEAPVRKYTLTFVPYIPMPDEAVRPIYREIFPNTSGVREPLMTADWIAHGGSNGALMGYSDGQDAVSLGNSYGPAPPPPINSNPSDPDTDIGYTYHQTLMMPVGQPQILWTDEYTIDDSWKLTEVRWEQLLDRASLTPAFAVKVGADWFVTNQTGIIENAAPSFDVVSLDLMTATWSALDFEPGQSLAQGSAVTSLPEGDILAFGLFIGATPANADLRFDNITILARMYIPGDLNGDGFVGADDLDILRAFWGQDVAAGSRSHGDLSGDGFVGADDLDLIRANWGQGTPPLPATIPEPSSLVLLIAGGLALVLTRRGCDASCRSRISAPHHSG